MPNQASLFKVSNLIRQSVIVTMSCFRHPCLYFILLLHFALHINATRTLLLTCENERDQAIYACNRKNQISLNREDIDCTDETITGDCICTIRCFANQADYNQWYGKTNESTSCFPGSSYVVTEGGRVKYMRDVKLGDSILTVSGTSGEFVFNKVSSNIIIHPLLDIACY